MAATSRSTIGTTAGPARSGRLGDLRSRGSRPARVVLPLAIVAALVIAAWALTHRSDAPLEDLALVGPRGPQCTRLVIASDVSGSMDQVASARDAAIATLLTWLPGNLRPDDEVAALTFASTAGPVTGPTSIGSLDHEPLAAPDAPTDMAGTSWQPVIDTVGALPSTACGTALLVVSDADADQLPAGSATARSQLAAIGVDDLALLVPSPSIAVPDLWSQVYPYAAPVRFDGTDRQATARAMAQAIATVTGQSLGRR